MTFKAPMLAASLLPSDVEHTDVNILEAMSKLRYPVLATLKKDGIRAIKLGELASKTLKRIPNLSIQERAKKLPAYFDMELFNPELQYDEIESIVMSREHLDSDKIEFHLLDWFNEGGFGLRYTQLALITMANPDVIIFECAPCNSPTELFDFFVRCEQQNGEGICFRTPDSPYKQGRSTLKEQYLVKLSRYIRQEVTIIGFEEQLMNTNSEKRSPIGMMARRKTVGGFGKNTLGAFIVQDKNGLQFNVGTGVGLTNALRKKIWDDRDYYHGKQITIKHKPHGQKIKPRSPIFVGFREEGF